MPGRKLYNEYCYFCHGYSGDARTIAASYLDPSPRAFTALAVGQRSRQEMIETVQQGIAGTAMMSFEQRLSESQIGQIIDYIRQAFMHERAQNTRYHIPANGWPNHERYRAAYPFVLGQVPLSRPWDRLTEEQRQGRRLFMQACVTCHDLQRDDDAGQVWDSSAVSFPRGGYSHRRDVLKEQADSLTAATPFARHERPKKVVGLSPLESEGERLFQNNCAFCHAADGTGKGWIGRFLERHPRDLTDARAMAGKTAADLRRVIRDGLPGTTMSAWRGVLDDGQIAAIIAYIQRVFIPPAASLPAGRQSPEPDAGPGSRVTAPAAPAEWRPRSKP